MKLIFNDALFFLKSVFSLILIVLLICTTFAQQSFPYEQLAGTSWNLKDFDARYHRSAIKGSPLLFQKFMLGKIVNPNGQESEPLYLNFDTVGKKGFLPQAKQAQRNS